MKWLPSWVKNLIDRAVGTGLLTAADNATASPTE
jgi:hypothetical protein